MKRPVFLLIISSIFLLFSSCSKVDTSGNPYYQRWGNFGNPSEWIVIKGNISGYTKLKDIHPEKVRELQAALGFETNQKSVVSTTDGFLHAGMKTDPTAKDATEEKKIPIIQKFNSSGKLIWEKEYGAYIQSGSIGDVIAYTDDSFLFSIQTYPYYIEGGAVYEECALFRCDKNGEILWKREFEDYTGRLMTITLSPEPDIIYIVGDWREKDGIQTKEEVPDSIVVTRLDSNGNVVQQKSFGGSDFDNVHQAAYHPASGLVLLGSTQSHDGDFALENEERRKDFLACMDEKFEMKWVVHAAKNESFSLRPILDDEGSVYLLSESFERADAPGKAFCNKFDRNGNEAWRKQMQEGYQGKTIVQFGTGDIIIGVGKQYDGIITILDSEGNEKVVLTNIELNPEEIYPVKDGGFIVLSTRIIKTVPQPPIISSIWYDTELVAVKYQKDLSIEWRKTYDKYKDQMGWESWLAAKGWKHHYSMKLGQDEFKINRKGKDKKEKIPLILVHTFFEPEKRIKKKEILINRKRCIYEISGMISIRH